MKKVAGGLKLALSQYRDLEAFASFASDLDAASRAQLDRGARLVELLKQPQYSPFPVERQVVSLWVGTNGYLDDVPLEDVGRFEREFLDYVQRERPGSTTRSGRPGNCPTTPRPRSRKPSMSSVRASQVTGGDLLVQDEPAEPTDEARIEREPVKASACPPADRVGQPRRGTSRESRGRPSMAGQLRAIRQRIRGVQSIAKITRAQELIAASRIIKAQQRVRDAGPYAREITQAVEAVVSRSAQIDHPLVRESAESAAGRGADPEQRPRASRRLQRNVHA